MPNWEENVLNIGATLAEFLGASNNNATLPKLKEELNKNYKNVVCICWDGMGIVPIETHLNENDFLRANITQVLTSTVPSSTPNATTSLTCNVQPLEHGWLGYSIYFDDINRNVDIYKSRDSITREPIEYDLPLFDNKVCFFDVANTDYEINVVAPDYFDTLSEDKKIIINSEEELCEQVEFVCKKQGKQFVYAYFNDPDATMHKFGMSSVEASEKIKYVNELMQKLYQNCEDTLFVITADHGHIDIQGYVEFYKDKELNDMLECVPYLDARVIAFRIKENKKEEFEKKFKERYSEDFEIYKTSDLIEKGVFGRRGKYEYLLGDYIAIGTYTYKQFVTHENMKRLNGNHSGMTDEMLLPMILIGKK